MKPLEIKPGDTYNQMVIIEERPSKLSGEQKIRMVYCRCHCGKLFEARLCHLRSGSTRSCGCSRLGKASFVKHGMFGTPEYNTWRSMKARCFNSNDSSYLNYGGRGISVCERWMQFDAFLVDMGRKPSTTHSLDRVDVNGNYEPSNCRWANKKEQARNTRSNVLTDTVASQIKAMLNMGVLPLDIASTLGVTAYNVYHVKYGECWQ